MWGAALIAPVHAAGVQALPATETTPAPPAAAPVAQQFTLSNGMTLIVRPDRRAPTVAHMLWVRVGAMDEVSGTSGVAHVLEHMLFKGTPSLAPGEFSRRMAALGARENAFTSRDATGYHQQLPSNQLEAAMRLEADRFANNQWADEEFVRELAVVKEERRQRTEESPRARMFEAFSALSFQAHPYRRPIVGWMSDLDAMTPQDARDFYRRWYVPINAAVVIAGDVDVAQVQALVVLGYQVPKWTGGEAPSDQDALALTVLSAVLDGYSGARLERGLVQGAPGQRIADSAGASYGLMGRGPQQFVLTAVPAAGVTAAAAEAALKAQVQRIARDGIAPNELKRVITQWTAAEVYQLDSVFNQARELGSYWVDGMPLDTGEQLMARLRGVTPAQVQSVAQRHFSDEQLTTAVLVPDPSKRAPAAPDRPRPALGRH